MTSVPGTYICAGGYDDDHPVRKWLRRRNLWVPGAILPAAVRWLPERVKGRAGSIVVAAAPPEHWLAA